MLQLILTWLSLGLFHLIWYGADCLKTEIVLRAWPQYCSQNAHFSLFFCHLRTFSWDMYLSQCQIIHFIAIFFINFRQIDNSWIKTNIFNQKVCNILKIFKIFINSRRICRLFSQQIGIVLQAWLARLPTFRRPAQKEPLHGAVPGAYYPQYLSCFV